MAWPVFEHEKLLVAFVLRFCWRFDTQLLAEPHKTQMKKIKNQDEDEDEEEEEEEEEGGGERNSGPGGPC